MPGTLLFGALYEGPVIRLPETTLEDDPRLYDQAVFVVGAGFVEPPFFRRILRAASVHLVLLASPLVDFAPLLDLLRFNDGLPPMPAEERAFVCAARPYVRWAPPFHFFETHRIRCSPHQTQSYRRAKNPKDRLCALTMSYPKHQTFKESLTRARGAFSYVGEKCFANLPKYSPKLQRVVDAARAATPSAALLVYSRFLTGGAIPAALALEEAGFRRPNSLLRADPGNGLKYAFFSKDGVDAFSDLHVAVVAHLFLPIPNVRQIIFLDSPPLEDVQRVLSLCAAPNLQVFFYTSQIDLDEEAADAALLREALEAAEPLARRLLPPEPVPQILADGTKARFRPFLPAAAPVTPAECLRELFLQRLWHPRADLLGYDLAAFVRTYFKNRFGHYGFVARFDDYYVFCPAGALETEYLQTLAGETPWGAAAAPFLQGLEEKTRARVVAAHVADVHNLAPSAETPFHELIAAHTAVADVAACVGPHGLSLWRKRGKWVPERLFPFLRTLNPDADLHTAPVELEIRLRLEGHAFLREADFL